VGEIHVHEFMSLDGVTQAPGGPEEDTTGGFRLGGWVVPHFDDDMGGIVTEVFSKTGAFLLGRRTYDIFAAHWPHITDPNDFIAKQLNTLPRFVASRSTNRFAWKGTTGIRNAAEDLAALKTKVSGELQLHGSGNLAQTLIEQHLAKAARVIVYVDVCHSGMIGSLPARSEINDRLESVGRANQKLFGLMASQPNQSSHEGPEYGGGHGVFTYFLLSGLNGAADANQDGRIHVNEIIFYVQNNVATATKLSQIPRAFGALMDLRRASQSDRRAQLLRVDRWRDS